MRRSRGLGVKPLPRRLERHVVLVDSQQQPLGPNLGAILTEWPAPPSVQSHTTDPAES